MSKLVGWKWVDHVIRKRYEVFLKKKNKKLSIFYNKKERKGSRSRRLLMCIGKGNDEYSVGSLLIEL